MAIERKSGATLITLALGFRAFFQAAVDMPELLNADWLALLAALVFALPAALLVIYVSGKRGAVEALQAAGGPFFTRAYALLMALTATYDLAFAIRALAGSAAHGAMNDLPIVLLMFVSAAAAGLMCMQGRRAVGGMAVIVGRIMLPIAVVVVLAQANAFEPAWLAPPLGPGVGGIARGAYALSGVGVMVVNGWLLLEAGAARACLKGLIRALAIAALVAVLFALLVPAMPNSEQARLFRLDLLLSNGRAPLALQLPLIVIWYGGLTVLCAFDAVCAATALSIAIPRVKPVWGGWGAVLAALCLGICGLTERATAQSALLCYYPILAGPLALFAAAAWIKRRRKGKCAG